MNTMTQTTATTSVNTFNTIESFIADINANGFNSFRVQTSKLYTDYPTNMYCDSLSVGQHRWLQIDRTLTYPRWFYFESASKVCFDGKVIYLVSIGDGVLTIEANHKERNLNPCEITDFSINASL